MTKATLAKLKKLYARMIKLRKENRRLCLQILMAQAKEKARSKAATSFSN